ncbi:MAG: S8 family serine peptidase, partial [Methanococcaceae archaeon]
DDNSHGTHVAGIAAAVGNNGIGIAGVNWNAKLVVLKVFQSSGRGDVSVITQGIVYASNKGATVINMSFGGVISNTMEQALANAYAHSILVGAAGNNGLPLPPCIPSQVFYPAALSYVLGVEASQEGGGLAGFSNYDCDGPTFSQINGLENYELRAPGAAIISTIPGGNYRVYSGTSMAAPLISGAVSLYRKLIPDETQEYMWVKLIFSRQGDIKLLDALHFQPKPLITQISRTLVDTLAGDDNDGRVDAGETVEMYFTLRNVGGHCDSAFLSIKMGEFEDTSMAHILKDKVYVGSMSPYATRLTDAFKISISPNASHDRDIVFETSMWWKGGTDTTKQKLILTAENGEQLFGVLDYEKTLYPNKLYLVNNSFKVAEAGTLIIKPGVKMLFYPGKTIPVSGRLIAEGKPDSLISFKGYSPPGMGGAVSTIFSFRNNRQLIKNRLSYCSFDNLSWPLSSDNYMNPASVFNSVFTNSGSYTIGLVDSVVDNLVYSPGEILYTHGFTKGNNFIGPSTSSKYYFTGLPVAASFSSLYYNNFINYGMTREGNDQNNDPAQKNNWISEYMKYQQSWNGSFYVDTRAYLEKYKTYYQNSADFQYIQHQYWGTIDTVKMENVITDFMEYSTHPRAVYRPFLDAPTDSAHAIVWKVLVNGKDAQDEVVEPVGVGRQRFDVYFSKAMDKTVAPQISFGVRYPFSSNFVDEDGSWSENGKIYTAYKNIKLYTGDGINRVRVTGAKDLDKWEIPIEDMRFEFLISAAGSSANGFNAVAGLGKVALDWEKPEEVQDVLGYNLYRFNNITDTTFSSPILLNNALVTDTVYSDFNVIPNKKYYYYFKVVSTDFSESDASKTISSIPFTAALGDANGDLSISVLDILTDVSHILGQNPQPFIFDAADVVRDSTINILDVVGTVNIVLHGALDKYLAKGNNGNAKLELVNNKLKLTTEFPIAG